MDLHAHPSASAKRPPAARPPLWWVRLTQWEYWPWWAVYVPVLLRYPFWALRYRAWAFFSNVNPAIPGGGLAGESKWQILQQVPADLLPGTLYVLPEEPQAEVLARLQAYGLDFPLIAKPDVGERGRLVQRVADVAALAAYRATIQEPILLQTYVDLPLEAGILYWRMPGAAQGHITSIVYKDFLSVTGDGKSTVMELMQADPRARMQLPRLQATTHHDWQRILPAGETLVLEPIGNHSRGTTFRNGNAWITPAMHAAYDQLFDRLQCIHYARLDVRAASVADLQAGRIVILEVNGVASEPAHIYEPGYSLWTAWRELVQHWRIIGRIGDENRRRGHPYLTLRQGWALVTTWHQNHKPNPS